MGSGFCLVNAQLQHALQWPLRMTARLVLHAVAPSSSQRSVKRPKRRRQRLSVRKSAAQYFASAEAMGCWQRASRAAASEDASSWRVVAACAASSSVCACTLRFLTSALPQRRQHEQQRTILHVHPHTLRGHGRWLFQHY